MKLKKLLALREKAHLIKDSFSEFIFLMRQGFTIKESWHVTVVFYKNRVRNLSKERRNS